MFFGSIIDQKTKIIWAFVRSITFLGEGKKVYLNNISNWWHFDRKKEGMYKIINFLSKRYR